MTREREREREITNICNSCRVPIHENEVTYVFDKNIDKSKKIERPSCWIRCKKCYDQLRSKVEKYYSTVSSLWKWGSIVNGVISLVMGYFAKDGFFKDKQISVTFLSNQFEKIHWKFAAVFLGSLMWFGIWSSIIWIIRLTLFPYSMVEELVYSVEKEEKEEIKENLSQV